MKMLISKDNVVIAKGENIEFGIYDEPFEKWKITDNNEGVMYYFIDDGFTLIDGAELPSDFKDMKYCYTEEQRFYLNPKYEEPINTEGEVKRLTQENIDLKAQLDKVQEVLDYLVMQ